MRIQVETVIRKEMQTMPTNKNKPKDKKKKTEPIKLQPRNINKSTKAIFEDKRKKPNEAGQ